MSFNWDRELVDRYDPATDEALDAFEQQVNAPLPQDYRAFLKKYNGGELQNAAQVRADALPNFIADLPMLGTVCTIDPDPHQWHSIFFNTHLRSVTPIDDGVICIMHGGYLSLFLSLRGEDAGSVVVLSNRGDDRDMVAPTFDALLSLIEYIPDDDRFNRFATIPVLQLVEQGDDERIRQYLREGGNPNVVDEHGTPLISAANRQPHIVQILIDAGADIHLVDRAGASPLWNAASGSYDSLKLLLAAGGDPHQASSHGFTPLWVSRDLRSFKLLLSLGADIHARSKEGHKIGGQSGIDAKRRLEILLDMGYDLTDDLQSLRRRIHAQRDGIDSYKLNQISEVVNVYRSRAHMLIPDLEALLPIAEGFDVGRVRGMLEKITGA